MHHFLAIAYKAIATIFCLVLVILAGGLGFAREHGLQLLSVESGSMAPYINKGDAVFIDQHPQNLQIGQVVSYRSPRDPGVTITHRIVARDYVRDTITTKGDNLLTPDPVVFRSTVKGIVRYRIPHLGFVLDQMRHPIGLVLAVYLPSVSIIISELRRLQQYYGGRGSGHYLLHGF